MKALFFAAWLIVCSGATAAVWNAEHHWSDQWEQKYARWVGAHWGPEVFASPSSPYFGTATDCTDACYDMRLIFAYQHGLPFVINNPASTGGLISNEMTAWDARPQQERVESFIRYVNNATTSETIPNDTYPIAITKGTFNPGIIYVQPGEHCYQIVAVDAYGVPGTMFSTVPRTVRDLSIEPNFPIFVPSDTVHYRDGYRRFRWPEYLKLPVTRVPGFSDEQLRLARSVDFDYARFTDILMRRLGGESEPAPLRVRRFMYNLCYVARNRVEPVRRGTDHLAQIRAAGRRCMTPAEYYNYSTVARDLRLRKSFLYVRDLIGSRFWSDPDWGSFRFRRERYLKPYAEAIFGIGGDLKPPKTSGSAPQQAAGGFQNSEYSYLSEPPGTVARWTRKVTNDDLIAWCGIEYAPGKVLSLHDLWRSITRNTLSPNPNETLNSRWGLVDPPPATGCPKY